MARPRTTRGKEETRAPGDAAREKILEAADALFGERGFDATTTRDIAARARVNKALIHYYYGTKDELLDELLDRYYARLTATLTAALAEHARAEQQAEAVLDAYADFLAANRAFCSIVQREIQSGLHTEKVVARTLPSFVLGRAWLGPLAEGAPEELELTQLLTTVYGMVVSYFTYGRVLAQITGADPFSPRALAARKKHVRVVVGLLFKELRRSNGGHRADRSSSARRTVARPVRKSARAAPGGR